MWHTDKTIHDAHVNEILRVASIQGEHNRCIAALRSALALSSTSELTDDRFRSFIGVLTMAKLLAFKLRRNNPGSVSHSIAAEHLEHASRIIHDQEIKLQGYEKIYEKIYEAHIPSCCSLRTLSEHADSLMLCWGVTSSMESATVTDCGSCEYRKKT